MSGHAITGLGGLAEESTREPKSQVGRFGRRGEVKNLPDFIGDFSGGWCPLAPLLH